MTILRDGVRRLLRLSLPGTARKQVSATAISADHVRDVILASVDAADGGTSDWRVEGPVVLARSNHIFKATNPRARYPLAVKVAAPEMPPGQIAARAEMQRIVHERLRAQPGLTVPEIVAALPAHRAIVMEWIDEPSVRQLLTEAGKDCERRAALFDAAGRWLRAYHEQGGIAMLPLNAAEIAAGVEASLRGKGAKRRDRPTASYAAAYNVLVEAGKACDGRPVPHAPAHGDYHGKNLFHGRERIIGIDLGVPVLAPVATDICRFLVQGETTKPFLTRKSSLDALGIERPDLEAFLAGYDPERELIEIDVFRYLFLAEVLRRWATIFGRSKGPFHAVRYAKHFRLRRMARYAAAAVGGRVS
jgi:hypothetical protein